MSHGGLESGRSALKVLPNRCSFKLLGSHDPSFTGLSKPLEIPPNLPFSKGEDSDLLFRYKLFMGIELHDTVIRNKDLISSSLDEDLVMLSVQTGKYYGVNSVGKRIWELLEHFTSISQICDQLMQEFEVSREQCEQEVLCFLNELAAQRLLSKPADACCSLAAS